MTKVKDLKAIINAIDDDYLLMVADENGHTHWATIEINTQNKAVVIK